MFHHNIDYDFKSVGMKQTNPLCQKYVFHNFDLDEWTSVSMFLVLQYFCFEIDKMFIIEGNRLQIKIILNVTIWIFYDRDDDINQNNTLTQRVMSNKGYYCWDRIAKKKWVKVNYS